MDKRVLFPLECGVTLAKLLNTNGEHISLGVIITVKSDLEEAFIGLLHRVLLLGNWVLQKHCDISHVKV